MLNTFKAVSSRQFINKINHYNLNKFNFHTSAILANKISSATSGVQIPEHILNLNADLYDKKADLFLEDLTDQLEAISDEDPTFISSVDSAQGVIEFNLKKVGSYVINKKPPNKQIWLSSPISGPFRFDYDSIKDNWVSLRDDNIDLLSHLNSEIKQTSNNKHDLEF